jgi:phage-related tail protein
MRRKVLIISILLLVIASSAICSFILHKNKVQKEKEELYVSRLNIARDAMISGAITMAQSLDEVSETWSTAIENDRDFNTRLAGLYDSEDFSTSLKSLEKDTKEVNKMLGLLSETPLKYKELNSEFDDFYDAYQSLYAITTSPKGSLVTFNSAVSERKDKFIVLHRRLLAKVPYEKLRVKKNVLDSLDDKDSLKKIQTNLARMLLYDYY